MGLKTKKKLQNMLKVIKLIDWILGRTGVHITDTSFNYVQKNVDIKNIPKEGEIIYFGDNNYEVAKIIHNYENYRHTILIAIIPMPHKIMAEAVITFDKDKK